MEKKTLLHKVSALAKLVGNTPVRKIRIDDNRSVYLKEEGQNPAGSIKDRPALNMLLRAIEAGQVNEDTIVAESTSGNTGIGMAWVCSELGLEYHNYSPSTLSERKQEILRGYGAHLHFSDGGTDEATKLLQADMDANPGLYFWASQFTNENNWRAHLENTAPELLGQIHGLDEVWVAFGSGGTSTGFAHALNGTGIDLRVVQNTLERAKRVEGMRNLAWITKPPIADLDAIGEKNMYDTDPETYFNLAKKVYEENNGFLLGTTTAAILTQAVKSEAPTIAIVSPDNGERYPEWAAAVTGS
ncbi:MAG: pyridoxal-phosphate dependent enzyme [Chloroflexota bacterium]